MLVATRNNGLLDSRRTKANMTSETLRRSSKGMEGLKKNPLDLLTVDPKFLFGTQTFPTPAQAAREFLASMTNPIGARRTTQNEIAEVNRKAMERARILTYGQNVLGRKFKPRVEVAGMGGGGKLPSLPIVPSNFEMPEWFSLNLIPSGQNVTPDSKSWTPEARAHYVDSGDYGQFLANGGDPVPWLDNIVRMKAARRNPSGAGGSGEDGDAEEQKDASGLEEKHEETDDTQGIKKTPAAKFSEKDLKKLFIEAVHDGVPQKNKIKAAVYNDVYSKKGGREWFDAWVKANGAPKTDEDRQKLNEAWRSMYPTGDMRMSNPPQVPKYGGDTPDDGQTEGVEDPPAQADPEQLMGDKEQFVQDYINMFPTANEKQAVREYEYATNPNTYTEYDFDPDTGLRIGAHPFEGPGSPPPSKTNKPPRKGKKTGTSSPEDDPGFSVTQIDTDEKEPDPDKKKKEKPIPFPPQPKPPQIPEVPKPIPKEDCPEETEKILKTKQAEEADAVPYLRPLFERGGQKTLELTEEQKLQELEDWALFDLPLPDTEELSNPLHMKNHRDLLARFNGPNGTYKPKHFYVPEIRKETVDAPRIRKMDHVLKPQFMKSPFRDPFDRSPYKNFFDPDRHSETDTNDMLDRLGLHTEVAARIPAKPIRVSHLDLILALK
jgi:hypothetical protein